MRMDRPLTSAGDRGMNAVTEEVLNETVAAIANEKFPPRIRPNYYRDQFIGFRIETFHTESMSYRSIGFNFDSYKLAVLSLRAIETGNDPSEGSVTPVTDHYPRLKDYRNSDRIKRRISIGFILYAIAVVVSLFLMSGCSLTPASECEHGYSWRGDCAQPLFVE